MEKKIWFYRHPILTAILIIVLLGVIIGSISPEEEEIESNLDDIESGTVDEVQEYKPDNIMACIMTQSFVENYLKSPGSAEFASCTLSKEESTVNYQGNRTYFVYSYVDSQNSFGALIRTRYSAEIRDNEVKDLWNLLDIEFYD